MPPAGRPVGAGPRNNVVGSCLFLAGAALITSTREVRSNKRHPQREETHSEGVTLPPPAWQDTQKHRGNVGNIPTAPAARRSDGGSPADRSRGSPGRDTAGRTEDHGAKAEVTTSHVVNDWWLHENGSIEKSNNLTAPTSLDVFNLQVDQLFRPWTGTRGGPNNTSGANIHN